MNRIDPFGLNDIQVGNGLIYLAGDSKYRSTDGKDLQEKSKIDITRTSANTGVFNDQLELKVDALVLLDISVQSEADYPGYVTQTLPEGTYTGNLLDRTGSYDNPILLVNEGQTTQSGHTVNEEFGALIHPPEFTANPNRGDYPSTENSSWSKACQITEDTFSHVLLQQELMRLDYEFKSGTSYQVPGGIVGDPDSIPVTIKSKKNH